VLERHLPAAVAPDLHLRQRQVAGQAGSQGVRRVLHEDGAKIAKEVKYVPLPAKAYTGNLDHIVAKGKKGTVFGGKNEVGITIEDLMKREAKL
jgi:hypothetical protein